MAYISYKCIKMSQDHLRFVGNISTDNRRYTLLSD